MHNSLHRTYILLYEGGVSGIYIAMLRAYDDGSVALHMLGSILRLCPRPHLQSWWRFAILRVS
jgi:hypothetical protein